MNLRWPNAVTFLLVIFAFAFTQQTSFAQISTRSTNSLPKPAYYQTFPEYWSGDFNRAGRDFQRRYTTAYNFNNTRFLDSVCVLTMIGECHYNSGNYSDALASYEQALTLYLWPTVGTGKAESMFRRRWLLIWLLFRNHE